MQKLTPVIIVFLVLVHSVIAARIEGTVYNFYLDRLDGAIVEINTEPKQVMVANDGRYAFNVKPGNYVLKARYSNDEDFEHNESITISDELNYVIDLILEPVFGEDGLDASIEDIGIEGRTSTLKIVGVIFLVLAVFFSAFMLLTRKRKKAKDAAAKDELDPLATEVLGFIRQQDGRTTQKDVRKQFPASEAKISLVITELEHKGVIKKIKKGRGNVIILQKT